MILHTTYFGSVDWYRQLLSTDETVYIEACENYVKQTSRNRCEIATANGKQILTVPVTTPSRPPKRGGEKYKVTEVLVSDHGNWRHQHWETLKSSYGMSPFFEYYEDDIRPFFERRWETLFDYNLAIIRKVNALIGIDKEIRLTNTYQGPAAEPTGYPAREYYQTFRRKHGFIGGLSILDLLFNEGPQSILYLS